MMSSAQGSSDDCYFYFYSSCTKGDDCPFRHCQAALGTETVCSLWREGRCYREKCKFRHMESRINRSSIPCYWENQPGGCRKPHCVFLHQKSRGNVKTENKELIMPVSTNAVPSNLASKRNDAKDVTKNATVNSPLDTYSNHSDDVIMSPHPVEPFVVNFDEGEESDSESVSSTPVKSSSETNNCTSSKRNLMENLSGKSEETNFGIKTLEQIRMEKIHKESEHFYKSDDASGTVIPNNPLGVNRTSAFLGDNIFTYSAYDTPAMDSVPIKKTEVIYKPEIYPPESEFISVSDRVIDKSSNGDSNHLLADKERDLRSRLMKRKSPSYMDSTGASRKKIVSLRNKKDDDSLDFKIKTLEEIRKERENKSGFDQERRLSIEEKCSINSSSSTKISNSTSSLSANNRLGNSTGKIKLKRMSNETALNHNVLDEAYPNENLKKENHTEMVLHDDQSISEEQTKSENNKVFAGKRKEIDSIVPARNSKYLKTASSVVSSNSNGLPPSTNEMQNSSISNDKPVKKSCRPVIKRMCLTSPQLPIANSSISGKASQNNNSNSVLAVENSPDCPVVKSVSLSKPSVSNAPKENNISPVSAIKDCSNVLIHERHPVDSSTSPVDTDKKAARTSSVDEIEKLLNDGDINLDDVEGTATNEHESEDLLLEIEMLLDS